MAKVNLDIKATDKASPKLKGVTGSIIKATLAVDAIKMALTKMVQIGRKSIESLRTQEQAEAKLEEQLGHSIEANKAFASSIQELTTIGDETILQVQQLASSMGVAESELNAATEGAVGLSKAFGIDLNSSMKMVALANEGQYTMLARYIPELRAATTDSQKMAIVQEKVADGFNLAKAEAETFTGKITQLKNAQGDTLESFGRLVEIVGVDIVDGMMKGTKAMNEFLSSAKTLGAIKGSFDLLSEVGKSLGSEVFNELKTSVSDIFASFDKLKGSSMDNVNAFEIMSGALNILVIGINLTIKLIKLQIVAWIDWYNAMKEVALIAVEFFQALANPSKWGDVKKQVNSAKDAFVDMGTNIKDNVTDIVTGAIDDFKNLPAEIEKDAKKYEDIWIKSNEEVKKSFEKNKTTLPAVVADTTEKVKLSFLESTKEMFKTWNDEWEKMGAQDKFKAVTEGVKKWGDMTLGVVTEVLSTIQMAFDSASEERLAKINESMESDLEGIDERINRELEALGLAEETKAETLQREIDTLRSSLKTTKGLKDQAMIQEQIKEKQDALARQKIMDDGEKKKAVIRKKAAKKEYDEKKKQFEANKALQIANIWVNAASAIMGWLAAFAGMGIPGAVLFGVMTGVTLAMAGAQTGVVASQSFHGAEGGQIPNGATTGDRAVTYMNKGEALLQSDDYNMLVGQIRSGGAGGQVYIENFYSSARNLDEMIEELTEISRREGAR